MIGNLFTYYRQMPVPVLLIRRSDAMIVDANFAAHASYPVLEATQGLGVLSSLFPPMDISVLSTMIHNPGHILSIHDYTGRPVNASIVFADVVHAVVSVVTSRHDIPADSAAETRLRSVTAVISDFVFELVINGGGEPEIVWMSDMVEKVLGYTATELVACRDLAEMIHPEDLVKVQAHVRKIIAHSSSEATFRIRTKYQDYRWLRNFVRPIHSVKSEESRFIGVASDITDFKSTDDALQDSLESYRTLITTLEEGVVVTDLNGTILNANPSAGEILGIPSSALVGVSAIDFGMKVLNEDRMALSNEESPVLVTIRSGNPVRHLTIGLELQNTKIVWISVNTQPLKRGNEREFYGVVLSIRDITDIKVAMDEVYRLSLVARQTTSSVIITDVNRKIVWANPAFTRLTGFTLEEAKSKNPKELLSGPGTDYTVYKEIARCLREYQPVKAHIFNYKKNLEGYWVELTIDPMYDMRGKHIGFIAVQNDITQQYRHEQELMKAKEESEDMNRLKSTFLANISHELRTPMNGILAYADILRDEIEDPLHKKMISTIYQSGHRLIETINSILDLTFIESNENQVEIQTVMAAPIVISAVKYFEREAEKKNLTLQFLGKENGCALLIDERMFFAVMKHLIGNAVKFTENGGVRVEMDMDEQYGIIKISDTGIGITPEKQAVIFELFRQESEGGSRNYEGFGIGLSISKRFVEIMNGTITLSSTSGLGSVFTVTLPLANRAPVQSFSSQTELPGSSDI